MNAHKPLLLVTCSAGAERPCTVAVGGGPASAHEGPALVLRPLPGYSV